MTVNIPIFDKWEKKDKEFVQNLVNNCNFIYDVKQISPMEYSK